MSGSTPSLFSGAIAPVHFVRATGRSDDSSKLLMPNSCQSPRLEIMPSSSIGKMATARAFTRTITYGPSALVPAANMSGLTARSPKPLRSRVSH